MEPTLTTVRNRLAQLAEMRKKIDVEYQELEIAERVLTRLAAMTVSSTAAVNLSSLSGTTSTAAINSSSNVVANATLTSRMPTTLGTTNGTTSSPVTHKDLVIATLRTLREPWVESSRQLQTEIENAHGIHIKDNSLLPLLSGLKKDEIIRRDDAGRIALSERVAVARRM